jgi:hypothetical protein
MNAYVKLSAIPVSNQWQIMLDGKNPAMQIVFIWKKARCNECTQ